MTEVIHDSLLRQGFGFCNPNHAAALLCALLPFCWGWRRLAWLGWVVLFALCVMLAIGSYSIWEKVVEDRSEAKCRSIRCALCVSQCAKLMKLQMIDYVGVSGASNTYYCAIEQQGMGSCCNIVEKYLSAVFEFEESFVKKDEIANRNDILTTLRECLGLLKKSCEDSTVRFPLAFFRMCIERLEYSLVRIVEMKTKTITKDEVLTLLPDELFVIDHKAMSWAVYSVDYLGVVKKFRDMILIGLSLKNWREENAHYPESLGVLSRACSLPQISNMEYVHSNGVWQLFCPYRRGMKNVAPFNVYIPTITRSMETDWPLGKSLWLSSDFSQKRRSLFVDGVLNESNKVWRCSLINGRIVRN